LTHPNATDEFARSLRHIGEALRIPEWGCNVLVRPIVGELRDAVGTYPIALLGRNADLAGGLARLRAERIVSVVLVLDDFHRPDLDRLQSAFSFFRPFKTHYIRRAARVPHISSKWHRYNVRRTLKAVRTGVLDLNKDAPEWKRLYDTPLSATACPASTIYQRSILPRWQISRV
jgi:hypothetical protein